MKIRSICLIRFHYIVEIQYLCDFIHSLLPKRYLLYVHLVYYNGWMSYIEKRSSKFPFQKTKQAYYFPVFYKVVYNQVFPAFPFSSTACQRNLQVHFHLFSIFHRHDVVKAAMKIKTAHFCKHRVTFYIK